jgi:hypothetical protein
MKCSTAVFCQLILHPLLFFDRAFWVMASPDPSSHQSRQGGTCSGFTTWPPGLADYTSANTDENLRQWWQNHSSSGGRFDTQFGEIGEALSDAEPYLEGHVPLLVAMVSLCKRHVLGPFLP